VTRRWYRLVVLLLCAIAATRIVRAIGQDDEDDGWKLPASACCEVNPIPATERFLAKGKELFKTKCQKCHGPEGKGDGPDADPKHKPGNLSDSRRASRNPDGVMFYKIWNGRTNPKMPAFKSEMTRDDIWTVIQYVKTLRK